MKENAKNKINYKLDKEKLINAQTLSDKNNPLSEIRTKRSVHQNKEENPAVTNKKEQINRILSQFQKNNKSSSQNKTKAVSNNYMSRSKSKPLDFKGSGMSFKTGNHVISESKSFKSKTQMKFFQKTSATSFKKDTNFSKEKDRERETISHFDANQKRRRNDGKQSIVYPAYSASKIIGNSGGRNKKGNFSVTRNNNDIHRININLETEHFHEQKEGKRINLKKFSSSNTSEDLNLSSQNKGIYLYNIHKNNSSEVLELKNLEESSVCSDFKGCKTNFNNLALKLKDRTISAKYNLQSSITMNNSLMKSDGFKYVGKKNVHISPSPSNIQFIFRSPSNFEKKKLNRPFSHINSDKLTVQELTVESNTFEKSKNDSTLKKVSSQNDNKKEILQKINQLDDKKIGKLAKLLDKLDDIEIASSKKILDSVSEKVHAINKFNINYIQTDNINFGNININLNSTNSKLTKKVQDEEGKRKKNSEKSKEKSVKFAKSVVNDLIKLNDLNLIKSEMRSTKRSNSMSPSSNLSTITINILSTWGNQFKVGLTEIQLFDNKFQKVNIAGCKIINGGEESLNKLHNNKIYTTDEADMWTSSYTRNIRLDLLYKQGIEVDSIIVWNFNGRDLTKGVKEIEVFKGSANVWKGTLNKGNYSLKSNFSTHIPFKKTGVNLENIEETKKNQISSFIFEKRETNNSEKNFPSENKEKLLTKKVNQIEEEDSRNKSDLLDEIKHLNEDQEDIKEDPSRGFRTLSLLINSNWGDSEFVGLNKIYFLDQNGQILSKNMIESFTINTTKCGNLESLFDESNEVDFEPWSASINPLKNICPDLCEFEPIRIDILFKDFICLKGITFFNYNVKDELSKCARQIEVVFDNNDNSGVNSFVLRQGLGELNVDYSQTVKFPLTNYVYKEEEIVPFKEFKPASLEFTQDFDTPYLPTGFVFKFILVSNWGDNFKIGLKKIELFDQNGNSINKYLTPKIFCFPILSNFDLNDENKNFFESIISETNNEKNLLNGKNNGFINYFVSINKIGNEENQSNSVYFIFERPISISYIEIWNYSKSNSSGVKQIILLCDSKLIFKGNLKKAEDEESSCCILFTSDKSITNKIKNKIYSESFQSKKYKIENLDSKTVKYFLFKTVLSIYD